MTVLVARPPLQILSMSSLQSGSRRHSARLQQKDDHALGTNGTTNGSNTAATKPTSAKAHTATTNPKKRKGAYEEEDDGFVFSRVKKKRARQSVDAKPGPSTTAAPITEAPTVSATPKKDVLREADSVLPEQEQREQPPPQKKRTRMSFSTPASKAQQPVRRSKRLSTEAQADRDSPAPKESPGLRSQKIRKEKSAQQKLPTQTQENEKELLTDANAAPTTSGQEESHSSTKIALPFADTPVISRNKAMRQGKSGKSERRSSLGLRGRRASSLIDSGTSNGKSLT